MKNRLKKSAPYPRAEFVRKLEQQLLNNRMWEERKISISTFSLIKSYSFISVTGLVIAAISFSLLYSFMQRSKDYVAQAKTYYDLYNWDAILYQKKQIYSASPKETYDADATYTLQTWTYETQNEKEQLTLSEKIAGEMWETVPDDQLDITDKYGNNYSYADPKKYVVRKTPVNEAPYCVQSLYEESEDSTKISSHAFEASPTALEVFQNVFLPKNITGISFDQDGELRNQIYLDEAGRVYPKDSNLSEDFANPKEMDVEEAIMEADSAPKQAKLLFELLSQGQSYTQESRTNENGETVQVFRLPAKPYNLNVSNAKAIQEFIFNNNYELLEANFYKDDTLMEQVKYLETKALSSAEKETIFNPETYGLKLTTFDHPLSINKNMLKNTEGNLSCYSFQNETLSAEETAKLAKDYITLIQNIKDHHYEP